MKKQLLIASLFLITFFSLLNIKCSAEIYGIYEYIVTDGEVTINSILDSSAVTVEVPSTIEDYPVTQIGNSAFRNCTKLISVTIPDSVTSIGISAFEGCESLIYIDIPKNITTIKSNTFYGCKSLKEIVIPDGVIGIGSSAFSYCESLESIKMPVNMEWIDSSAFSTCKSLTNITIPQGIKNINNTLFSGCTSLTDVVIPNSVTLIGISAFNGCTNLNSIIIPENVVNIWSSAFANCTSLTNVVIPTSIETIETSAFRNCTALSNVYYLGDSYSWKQISIGDYNEDLKYAQLKFNYKLIYPSSVTISNESITLSVGETTTLIATVLPENSYDRTVHWVSSDNEIATVSKDGIVTAISTGVVKISSITNVGEKVAYCYVTVTPKKIPCPEASRESGEIIKGTKVVLASPISGVDIYYTVDGSIPTTKSAQYLGAIEVNKNMTINAIAAQEGKSISDVVTFTYTVTETDLPVLSILDKKCVLGEYVDIIVQVQNNPGTAVIGFDLEYKNGAFSLLKVENGEIFSNEEMSLYKGRGIVRFTFLNCSENTTKKGALCTLRFHSNPMWSGDKYEFKIHNIECYDFSENNVDFYGINGNVIVVDPSETQ